MDATIWKRIWKSAISVPLGIIGLAGIPDNVKTWAEWLALLDHQWARTLMVAAGLIVLVWVNRSFIRKPLSSSRVERLEDPETREHLQVRTAVPHERVSMRDAIDHLRGDVPAAGINAIEALALLHAAIALVERAASLGEIEVLGMPEGSPNYESIPATYWETGNIDFMDAVDRNGSGGRTRRRTVRNPFIKMNELRVYRDQIEAKWERGEAQRVASDEVELEALMASRRM